MVKEVRKEEKKAKKFDPFEGEQFAEDVALYEVGYHLLPTIPEGRLGEKVSLLKEMIEARGGVAFSNETPKAVELAYRMGKIIEKKRVYFTSAFFGWVAFRIVPSKVGEIKEALALSDDILRFLIVRREEGDAVIHPPTKFTRTKGVRSHRIETLKPVKKEPAVKLSEEELDKAVQELVTE